MEAYLRYGPALVRKAQRLLGNTADAQDVVQALFVDLVSQGSAQVELPYLYRAVTNRCLTLLRDGGNRLRLLSEHGELVAPAPRTRCDDAAVGHDLMRKALEKLAPREREVLVFRYFDDLTQDEIAELLTVSRKTIGHDLDRIRDVIRALRSEGGAP